MICPLPWCFFTIYFWRKQNTAFLRYYSEYEKCIHIVVNSHQLCFLNDLPFAMVLFYNLLLAEAKYSVFEAFRDFSRLFDMESHKQRLFQMFSRFQVPSLRI